MPQIPSKFIKIMAQIACRAVAVVGERFDDDRDAARAVALVDDILVAVLVVAAGRFFDDALDVLVRNVERLRLGDQIAQLAVRVGIGTALSDADGNLTADLGKNLGALLVGLAFFALDGTPFGMSGQIDQTFLAS